MRRQIKICGLARHEDVEAAIGFGADFLGFVVEAKSPRRLGVGNAARLARPAKGLVKTVAVTVNADDNLLADIINNMHPDYIQFHGDEDFGHLQNIKSKYDIGIIKAVKIADDKDLFVLAEFENICDYILLDAKPPKYASRAGGHGISFDWELLQGIKSKTPLILAGGLSVDNISSAKQTGIDFFDISSGLEARAGIKDHGKIKKFMEILHE